MSDSPDLRDASFRDLYRAWEDHPWSSSAIDLSLDAKQWTEELDERQRESALWNYAMFLKGVETEARTLSAVMDATPFEDQRAFLATQIVDEARHRMFLDRWLREVAGQGEDPASTLSAVEDHLTWGFRQVFEELERAADALRKKPRDRPLLTQAVVLCHVIIEAVLA
ncbi:MAG: sterol-binding protein, partial [Actinomycetota bacterium]